MRLFARLIGARMSQICAPGIADGHAPVITPLPAVSDTVTGSTPAAA